MDESLSFTLPDREGTEQTWYFQCVFNYKHHFLEKKQRIQMFSATLSSPFGWCAQGRGCCEDELGVTPLSHLKPVAETDSERDTAAQAAPLLLKLVGRKQQHECSLGFWCVAGGGRVWGTATAWGSSRLTATFPLHFRHYGTNFLLAKL